MNQSDYISSKQAKTDLGDDGYFALIRWMREKGINNLSQNGEGKYVNEVFITKRQLNQFVAEQIRDFKGSDSLGNLWGQSREFLSRGKRK